MAKARKLVQSKNFDSYTPLLDVINEDSKSDKDICFEKYDILHSVVDTSPYKIGQEVQVDFDGDGFLIWNGEIAGIFKNDLLIYLY